MLRASKQRALVAACGLALGCPGMAAAGDATQVVLLGTGTPNADPARSGPALAVVVHGSAYLVDAGPGVVRRAAAAAQQGIGALAVEKLGTLFLTHLHSDHTLGLPDLIFSPWTLERTRPLRVFGPPGVKAMTRALLEAYREDVRVRLTGLEPANREGYKVEATEIKPGLVFSDANVRVTAFAVPHGAWRHAFGYRFDTADRVVVVSGDTTPSEAIVAACQGCDVLVHEVYSAGRLPTRPADWQRYHRANHTSTTELARIARQAGPKLLVLTHLLLWGATDEDLVSEVKAGYDGRVVCGHDLDVY